MKAVANTSITFKVVLEFKNAFSLSSGNLTADTIALHVKKKQMNLPAKDHVPHSEPELEAFLAS